MNLSLKEDDHSGLRGSKIQFGNGEVTCGFRRYQMSKGLHRDKLHIVFQHIFHQQSYWSNLPDYWRKEIY